MRSKQEYAAIVQRSAVAAGVVGVPGSLFPPLDMAGMALIWAQMAGRITKEAGHSVSNTFILKLMASVATSAGLYIGGSKLANWLLHLIPGAGNAAAAVTNSAFNYIYTKRLGKFLVAQFDKDDIRPELILSATLGAIKLIFSMPGQDELASAQADIDAFQHDHASSDSQSAAPHLSPEPADPVVASHAGSQGAIRFANSDHTVVSPAPMHPAPVAEPVSSVEFSSGHTVPATLGHDYAVYGSYPFYAQLAPQWLTPSYSYPYHYFPTAPYHEYDYYRQWWDQYRHWWDQYQHWWDQQASAREAVWAAQNPEAIEQGFAKVVGVTPPSIEHISDVRQMSDSLKESPTIYSHDCGWLAHLFNVQGGSIQINDLLFPKYVGEHGAGAYWTIGHELGHFYDLHHPDILPFHEGGHYERAERNADYFAGVLFKLIGKDPENMKTLFFNKELFNQTQQVGDTHLPGALRWNDFLRGFNEAPKWQALFARDGQP